MCSKGQWSEDSLQNHAAAYSQNTDVGTALANQQSHV